MFAGTNTALITPFLHNQVDGEALRALVEQQLAGGVDGLVVCGTTGEAAAMTLEERLLVIRQVVEQTRGRVPVIAGTGSNNTRATLEMTRKAAALKVDGVLIVTPYYVKPTQQGLVDHFAEVAKIGPPVVAYNVPGRTGVSMTVETVAALAGTKNVVALKEATGDMALDGMMIRAAGEDLTILSGDDFTCLPQLAIGGAGCISVVSNVAPRLMSDMTRAFQAGEIDQARQIHLRLLPLMKALFTESNPIPVKAAMALLGLCAEEIRPPLTWLTAAHLPGLEQAMADCDLRRESSA